jgi:hypothetical protein
MKHFPKQVAIPTDDVLKDRRELKTTKLAPPPGIRVREDYLQHNFPVAGAPKLKK